MSSFSLLNSNNRVILPTVLILITAIVAGAQSSPPATAAVPSNTPVPAGSKPGQSSSIQSNNPTLNASTGIQVTPADDAPEVNPVLRRIERARALAAAHQLRQAATDLENVRVSVNDVALRNVTSLMLIGIYLEEGNYTRSQALLEESFQTRAAQKDESLRTYFAMAGQTINGIRAHLARYRSFGLNTSDTNLPVEANTDLERIRGVLERVAAQAREIGNEAGRSYDALALQEDVLGVRLSLARDNEDRDKWQTQYMAVREKLASSSSQGASLGRSTVLDAVTARIPNPFGSKPNSQVESGGNGTSGNEAAKPAGISSSAPQDAATGAAEKSEPKLISTGSLSGRESKRVTPVYPTMARNSGVSGTVRVFAIIDENGKVWVTNSEGPTLLRKAAEDAARGWSFAPTLVSGKPVRVAGYLDFDFKL